MTDLFLIAAVAGMGAALLTGALGCFVVWRRLSYFGDALGHACLLGVALGLSLSIAPTLTIVLVALSFAVLLAWISTHTALPEDALLGALAQGALALSMVLVAGSGTSIDLQAYLFGDMLTLGWKEVAHIYVAAAMVMALLVANWPGLTMMMLSEDMATVEGVRVKALRLMLFVLLALAVAVALRVVGLLLVTSLLIVPACLAHPWASSPARMAVLATLAGMLAVLLGLCLAFWQNWPAGPAIILAALALWATSAGGRRFFT